MRFALALFALVASASASLLNSRQSIPNCATSCIANANLGGCGAADTKCLCNSQSFVSSTAACIKAACTGSDLTAAEQAAQALCAAVGVTLTASSTAASTASSTGSASTPTTTKPSGSSTSTSSSTSSAAAATKSGSASSNSVNALAGVAAFGLVALTVL